MGAAPAPRRPPHRPGAAAREVGGARGTDPDHPSPPQVSKDKLTVAYTGAGAHTNDVGAIQADHSAPRRTAVFYFEVTVLSSGERGLIGVGFTDAGAKLGRQPGWEPGTYGYHGDDGRAYHARGSGDPYGPRFGAGDVVGAGIDWEAGSIFFTRNGAHLGTAFGGVRGAPRLFPTVGLHSRGEKVAANFGASPFRFDAAGAAAAARAAAAGEAAASGGAAGAAATARALAVDYLLHAALPRTLAALEAAEEGASTSASSSDPRRLSLAARSAARSALAAGDVDAAEAAARTTPGGDAALADPAVRAMLGVQRFAETLRSGDAAAAVAAARGPLGAALAEGGVIADLARDAAALAAYADPAESPVGGLLTQAQRAAAADALNGALLFYGEQQEAGGGGNGAAARLPFPVSRAEGMLRQLAAAADAAHEAGGGAGEPFTLAAHVPDAG